MDKTRIIVVEDNIVYCEYVCNLLAREGYSKMCIRDRSLTRWRKTSKCCGSRERTCRGLC